MCDKQHSSRIARGRSATFDQDGASKRVSRLITEPWQPRRTPEIPKATSTRLSPPRSSPPSCKSRSRSGRRRGSPPSRWRRASPSSRCTGPSNVDHPGKLELLLAALVGIARRNPPGIPAASTHASDDRERRTRLALMRLLNHRRTAAQLSADDRSDARGDVRHHRQRRACKRRRPPWGALSDGQGEITSGRSRSGREPTRSLELRLTPSSRRPRTSWRTAARRPGAVGRQVRRTRRRVSQPRARSIDGVLKRYLA